MNTDTTILKSKKQLQIIILISFRISFISPNNGICVTLVLQVEERERKDVWRERRERVQVFVRLRVNQH